MAYLGIDIGSLSCDAVITDENGKMVASVVVPTGARNKEAIQRATDDVLRRADLRLVDIDATVATGYGRKRVDCRTAEVTEISCHARGVHHLNPQIKVLIDVGGQDSKAIRLGADGRALDFVMNDKCAAGTGRFLEAMARALALDLEEMSVFDRDAAKAEPISSMCTVFAESEVVSLVAKGGEISEIVAGLNQAIASRIHGLAKRFLNGLSPDEPIAMSGGVARNAGVVRAIGEALKREVFVPDEPDVMGALGAAIIAKERHLASQAS